MLSPEWTSLPASSSRWTRTMPILRSPSGVAMVTAPFRQRGCSCWEI